MIPFEKELEEFVASVGGCPAGVVIHPVPLSHFACGNTSVSVDNAAAGLLELRKKYLEEGGHEMVFVYEDLWRCRPELVRRRLRSHLCAGERIFARNCDIREISQETSASFLERHHIYGPTKSKYRYGLFRRRSTGSGESGMPDTASLVAVGTFSVKNEWERYASLPQVRVCGGMGKILKHFICDVHPDEVMSYADLEWGDGNVYRTLGFKTKKCTAPVHFLVNPSTYERVHIQKFERDKRFQNIRHDDWLEIANPGSMCMLLDVEQL